MNGDKSKDILEMYSGNDLSGDLSSSFEQWMLEHEGSEHQRDAMKALWDGFPEDSSADSLPSAESVLAEAVRMERNTRKGHLRYRILTIASMAAALVFGVLATFLLVSREKDSGTVCLVSSRDAKSDFVLPDGTCVWLNRGSRLYYRSGMRGRERKVRLEGEGYFDVYKDASRPFIVSSGAMDVKVLGTRFTLSSGEDERPAGLYLKEGSVEATVEGVGRVLLEPDQALTFNGETQRWVKSRVKASNHTSWIEDKLVFYNTSLYDIVENLEHWYSVSIGLDDEEAAKKINLSMTVRGESLDDILLAIKSMTKISFSYESGSDLTHISFINN